MEAVEIRGFWKIRVSSYIFFGLIPWSKYLQFCDDNVYYEEKHCTDWTFGTKREATDKILEIVEERDFIRKNFN